MKILKGIVLGLPNLPFIFLLGCYIYLKMVKNSGMAEMEIKRQTDGTLLTDEIKEWAVSVYPIWAHYLIAIIFWAGIIKLIL